MDHAPSTTTHDCPNAADACACQSACCAHCGAGQPTESALRHRRNLAEIGEIGMKLIRQIEKQTGEMGILGFQGAHMFDQITRAVRRAHALEAKIEADGLKTAAQRAAEWARQEAAALRAQRAEEPDRQVTMTAPEAKPRERDKLLNDLRDRDDTMNDFGDLDDLIDAADEDDPDDEHAGTTVDSLRKTLATAEKNLNAARAAAAGGREAVAAAPDDSVAAQAERRVAFALSGSKFPRTKLPLTPIPAALAWPPPPAAAHDPPR